MSRLAFSWRLRSLNRLLEINYSDGSTPGVSYAYDGSNVANGIGQLASVTNTNSATSYTYDAMRRVSSSAQTTNGKIYLFLYQYNLAGALTSETYPSGRVVATDYNDASRPSTTTGTIGGQQTNYVKGTTYWPHGAVNSYRYGNGQLENNLVPTYIYNSRLQVSNIFATVNNDNSAFIWNYTPDWGTTDNNGTLRSAWEGYGPPSKSSALTWLSQTYTYDGLNRLKSVSDSGGYTRSFGYDARGNMWIIPGFTGINPVGSPPSSADGYNAKNQVTTGGAQFDAAGNQSVINGDTLTYDAENRQISAYDSVSQVSETYRYDGAGQRVQKGISGGASTVYVYDAFGRLAAEYSSGSNSAPCTTCYLTWDQLGSTRLVTDQNANVVSWHDYLPFGEEIQANTVGRNGTWGSNTDATQKFTGQYRDGETNDDYFGARYYRPALGRFTSPDPGNAGADPTNPQSWNGYSYVWNNPLAMIDPSGADTCADGSYADACVTDTPPPDIPTIPVDPCFIFNCYSGGGGSNRQLPPPPTITEARATSPPKTVTFCLDASCTMTTQLPGPSDKQKYCMAQAFKKNAVSLGLDAASLGLSLVPGGGLARTIATTASGVVLTGTSSALSAINHQSAEAGVTFGTGVATSWPSVAVAEEVGAKTVARALPIVGTIVSGLELGYDGWLAYNDYQTCLAHP
jgi:RHS repeat-associated protein